MGEATVKDLNVRHLFPQSQLSATYLDSAATTLKVNSVIKRMSDILSSEVSNVHRGGHRSGNLATREYEAAREKVQKFIGAKSSNEVIFTRGTTESINLLACCLSQGNLKEGDEVLLSQLEHHSNIVPWQMWAERKGFVVKFVPVSEEGRLDFEAYEKMLSSKTKVVSLTHLSNALGVHVDVAPLFQKAKQFGALTILDAAQSVSAQAIDVSELHCDFLVFSGHKLFAPTGIGVLYGREDLLNGLPPYQAGGSMIDRVTEEESTYLLSPQRFEAGTPAIAEAICLGEAIDFVQSLDWRAVQNHDRLLLQRATEEVKGLGFKVFAEAEKRSHVVSFCWPGLHPSDFAALLSEMDIAVRSGHHCCQPLMQRLGVSGTLRASFSVYSNSEDVDQLIKGLKKAKDLLV